MKTVLAALDFSSQTTAVAARAVELAQALGARLLLVHAFTPPDFDGEPENLSGHYCDLVEASWKEAELKLRQAKQRIEAAYPLVDCRFVAGPSAPAILAAARDAPADCVVIGAQGHGKWHDLLFGSTTDAILQGAPCRVVVVPAVSARRAALKLSR